MTGLAAPSKRWVSSNKISQYPDADLVVQIRLKPYECVADCRDAAELVRGIGHRVVFELQQVRELVLIEFADTLIDILGENEIQK